MSIGAEGGGDLNMCPLPPTCWGHLQDKIKDCIQSLLQGDSARKWLRWITVTGLSLPVPGQRANRFFSKHRGVLEGGVSAACD